MSANRRVSRVRAATALVVAILGVTVLFGLATPVGAAELTASLPSGTERLRLGDSLAVHAKGESALGILAEVEKGAANRRLTLFLNGIEIPGLLASYQVQPELSLQRAALEAAKAELDAAESASKGASGASDATRSALAAARDKRKAVLAAVAVDLRFVVDRDAESAASRKAWDALLKPQRGTTFGVEVSVAVGTQSPVPVEGPGGAATVPFRVSDRIGLGYVVGILCLLLLIVLLVVKSHILRDDGDPVNAFSLARCQMAFWGVVVLSCFVGVATACGSLEHIPAQTLVLLGISASTALGASVIDGDDAPRPKSKRARIKGFFDDVCVGDRGASFHRIQLLLWTIVLGGFFVWNVTQVISMPEFSDTLLVLMGISNGTYLGFKTREPGARSGGSRPSAT